MVTHCVARLLLSSIFHYPPDWVSDYRWCRDYFRSKSPANATGPYKPIFLLKSIWISATKHCNQRLRDLSSHPLHFSLSAITFEYLKVWTESITESGRSTCLWLTAEDSVINDAQVGEKLGKLFCAWPLGSTYFISFFLGQYRLYTEGYGLVIARLVGPIHSNQLSLLARRGVELCSSSLGNYFFYASLTPSHMNDFKTFFLISGSRYRHRPDDYLLRTGEGNWL